MFLVYMHTNLLTNKSYIGYTKFSLEERWNKHCRNSRVRNIKSLLTKAIIKYGQSSEVWKSEILMNNIQTLEEAHKIEREAIAAYNTCTPNGYNLTLGGEGRLGVKASLETKMKQRRAHLGKKRPHSQQAKENMRIASKGKKITWGNKISQSLKGYKHTASAVANMTAAIKKSYENPNRGKSKIHRPHRCTICNQPGHSKLTHDRVIQKEKNNEQI